MSRSLIRQSFRQLRNHRTYAFINLFGLTIGFSACMVVAAIVYNALSYDRQWTNSPNLYRIMAMSKNGTTIEQDANTPTALGPALLHSFPAVRDYCRMRSVDMNLSGPGPAEGVWVNCLTADPGIFNLLDIHVLQGNPRQLVPGYPNLVISQHLRDRLFHNSNPIGRIITRRSDYNLPFEGKKKQYLITGIMRDMPANSHFTADALLLDGPWPGEDDLNSAFGIVLPQYILVKPRTNMAALTARVNDWYHTQPGKDNATALSFQPVTDIHLHPEIGNDPDTSGSMHHIYIYLIIAGLIMSIVAFNYLNLALAMALSRMPAIGIRSVLGATRSQIIRLSLSEAVAYFLIAFPAAALLFLLSLGPVATFIGHPLTLTAGQHIFLFSACGLILLILTLTSGYYPAWQLSRSNPALTIRGHLVPRTGTGLIRKLLIVGQFAIAVVLFVFIATITEQLDFINHKDLGFDKENLLCIDNNNWGTKAEAFRQELHRIAGVSSVSISTWNPALGEGYASAEVNDSKDSGRKIRIWFIAGDPDLTTTLKWQLVKGDSLRDRQPDPAANNSPVLITAYTAQLFGIKRLNQPNPILQGRPVGILKNFNNGPLRLPPTPCVINTLYAPTRGYILIRTTGQSNQQLPGQLQRVWQQFYPEKLLQYSWISDSLARQYAEEAKLRECFFTLGLLSLLLTCLGLSGLVAWSISRRVKEIGIRKALGASVPRILFLLSGTYLKLIGIAIAIASPIALWIGSAWLQDYAWRIELSWSTFVVVWLLILIIALLTLLLTIYKAAAQKPAISLHHS